MESRVTEQKILWENDFKTALFRARSEKKPVLLDFFNPG
ncbi:MAG: thioredoxin family protein [Firmicutes bacterium]|nr:thioredoxin family protein [Bacillota bacterium]